MRRRIAAVVIILATVALIVWALTAVARSGSNDKTEEPEPSPTLVTTPTEPMPSAEETTTEAEPSLSEEQKPPEDEAELAAKKTCEIQDLRVTVETDNTNYAEGVEPQLTGTIRNPTGADCVIDSDEMPLRFEIYRMEREGFQRMWGDTDCYPAEVTGRQVFKAGETRSFTTAWSRMNSRPGECSTRQPVPAGAYIAYASIGENTAEGVTFNLN